MMPVYMDSHPQQRNPVPSVQYYHPSYAGIPLHMMTDQAKSPMIYESIPHGSNCGYAIPCHGCCNHGNFPVYYSSRPPLSHFSPSPTFHCCGHHTPFTEPYPVYYTPPPHYSMEQPRYEYDKDMNRDYHCCGPNHVCNQKNSKGVKIEEQEPDTVKKSELLVPVQPKNYSYPVVWIPPESMKNNNEQRRSSEMKEGNQVRVPHSREELKSSEREPRVWNGWFPLDMDNLKSLMYGEDEKRKQNQQDEDRMRQFPHPIIWMPANDEQREAEKDQRKMDGWFPLDINKLKSLMQGEDEKRTHDQQDQHEMRQFPYPIVWMPSKSEHGGAEKKDQQVSDDRRSAEQPPLNFKFIPVKPSESDDSMNKSDTNKGNSGSQTKSSYPIVWMPSKSEQLEMHEDRSGDINRKIRDVGAERIDNIAAENSSGTSKKRESSSPPKTCKLPPVCLRVEPLSRKKNGKGTSRSPSPHGTKGGSQETPKDSFKPSALATKENYPLDSPYPDSPLKKSEEKTAERKTTDMADENNENLSSGSQMRKPGHLPVDSQEQVLKKSSTVSAGKHSDECKLKEDKGITRERDSDGVAEANKGSDSSESPSGECRKKKNLSDVEAAILIQSSYRGFEVRKLEPLKKLKQMAEIRKQVAEIGNRIKALESSPDVQKNDKEKVVIGEMIMRLLLKLDTIQGLHQSLRDVRKALARELVVLQGKLDSSMMKSSKEFSGEMSANDVVDVPSIDTDKDASTQEMQNKDVGSPENSFEFSHENVDNMKVQVEGQPCLTVDPVADSQSQGTLEPPLAEEEEQRSGDEINETLGASEVESQAAGSASSMELKDEAASRELVVSKENKEDAEKRNDVPPELEQSVQLPSISGEKITSEESKGVLLQDFCYDRSTENITTDSGVHVDGNPEVNALTELPLNLIDEDSNASDLEKNELVDEEKNKIVDGELKSTTVCGLTLPTETDKETMIEKGLETETNSFVELPVGVLETDVSELLDNNQIEIREDEVLSRGEAGYNASASPTYPMESEDVVKIVVEELSGNAAREKEEIQPAPLMPGKQRSAETFVLEEEGMIVVDPVSPESVVMNVDTQEFEGKKKEEVQQEADGKKKEEVLEKKPECQEPECVIDIDKMDQVPYKSESTDEDLLVGTPPSQSQRSIDENDMGMQDKKLIEENAKLREMMEKLMEAGKEQLNVISSLTGRVKDLERKLSRKKKWRTGLYKRAKPASNSAKLGKSARTERAFDVPM